MFRLHGLIILVEPKKGEKVNGTIKTTYKQKLHSSL